MIEILKLNANIKKKKSGGKKNPEYLRPLTNGLTCVTGVPTLEERQIIGL